MKRKKEPKVRAMIFTTTLFFILAFFFVTSFFLFPVISAFAQDPPLYPPLCTIHHESLRGPHLECTYCHVIPYPGYLKDNLSFKYTGVCNPCHSPDGQFNGVEDDVIGAKANWASGGVYDGDSLKPRKQKWCVGCHDDGSCMIQGVSAPNIAGQSIADGWESPVSIISEVTGADNLLDKNLLTGYKAGELIFDLEEPAIISHIRLYMVNASVFWDVYGSNDLENWTRILLGQGVLFAGPRWATSASPLGQWNESRLDKYIPFQYLKLIKRSPWPINALALREFEVKKDLQYGYYTTGHKMSCSQCHDVNKSHIDGDPRTYTNPPDPSNYSDPYNDDPKNYQNGYRLKMIEIDGASYPPLEIPRTGINWGEYPRTDNDFALCFSCHDKYNLLGDASSSGEFYKKILQTNFYNLICLDSFGNIRNQHIVHLRGRFPFGNGKDWDSDWDGTTDSPQSCTGCHDIHGTPSPVMIRHGELISTEEKDKAPSLNLYHLNDSGELDETVSLLKSIGGKTQFWAPGPGNPNKNGICKMCHNDSLTYLREPVEAVTCVACHARPFDTKRQITGDSGDFILPSHHVTDGSSNQIVKDQDCKACHDQTNHTEGTVLLRDADGGTSHPYDPADPSTAEASCLSCHDSDLEPPFSDGIIVPDIENDTFWSSSAHSTGGNSQAGITCMGDGVLTGCHYNAHGSQKPSLLAPSQTPDPQEEGICYSCHEGQMVEKDIRVPFRKAYRHPIERSGLHQTDENGLNLDPDSRHSECLDCHNPHSAGTNIHSTGGNLIAADSVLKGTWGVEPVVSPDNLAGQQISQFIELKAPNSPDGSTKEYQICFKCHSYYAFGYAEHGVTDIIGPSGDNITDQAMEFSPANLSAHPVVMETSAQPGAYEPKGLDPVQLHDPWKANAGHQTMYCSDCHGTDSVDTADAQGPHGSGQRFMLKDPSGGTRTYWPERPDGKLWTLFDLRNDVNDWQNKLFCAICHPFFENLVESTYTSSSSQKGRGYSQDNYTLDLEPFIGPTFINNVHQKGGHQSQQYVVHDQQYDGAPCVMCHTAVPHGSAVSRLIAYRTDVAPYNYGGNMAVITEFQKAGRHSYSKWSCSIPDEPWGCHTRGVDTPKYNFRIIYDPEGENPPRVENIPPQVVSLNEDNILELSEITIFSGAGCYDPDGSIFHYQWNFGDGTTANGLLTSHSYQTPGPHMVTLTVTDNEDAQSTDIIATITINQPNQRPVAEAGPDQTALVCQEVFFSGIDSYDPDGTITHYRWDFGDGITAEGPETSHIFDDFEHTYQVLLTVTDNEGAHHTDMATIIINIQ